LNNNYDFRSEIVLEQYCLLDPSFNLNTVKVANNPSGSNAKHVAQLTPDSRDHSLMKSLINYFKPSSSNIVTSTCRRKANDRGNFKENTAAPCSYLYMYNRDKTICYYHIKSRKDFIISLKIHYATFEKHLANGTYYLGKYLFTREFVQSAKFKEMSIGELISMLEKDREIFKRKD